MLPRAHSIQGKEFKVRIESEEVLSVTCIRWRDWRGRRGGLNGKVPPGLKELDSQMGRSHPQGCYPSPKSRVIEDAKSAPKHGCQSDSE